MEATALEKSLKPHFSLLKAILIYLGIALALGGLNLYAYISGSMVPLEVIEEEQRYIGDLSGILRNLFFVRVAAIAFCIYMIWKNSKNYKLGFDMPDHKLAFVGTLALAVFAFLYLLVKISYVQTFVNEGLMLLIFVISDAFLIALGGFMMRAANANKALRVVLPIVGNLLVYVVMFAGLMVKKIEYTKVGDIVTPLIFFAIISIFYVGVYLFTHRLGVATLFACLWSFALATYKTEAITTIGWSKIIVLVGFVVCVLCGVAGIVCTFIFKKTPADDLCEYEPAVEGFGKTAFMDIKSIFQSPRMLILALISMVSIVGTFLITSWDNVTDFTVALLDFLEKLFTFNFSSSGEMVFDLHTLYKSILELGSLLSLIPFIFLAVAFLLFALSKEQMQSRKAAVGWGFVKTSLILYGVMDAVLIAILISFNVNGFFANLPEAVYADNYILNYFAHYKFLAWITYAVIAMIVVMFAYKVVVFMMVNRLSKAGGEMRSRGPLFYPVVIITAIMGIPSIALAFWYTGLGMAAMGVLKGIMYFIIVTMFCNLYCKKQKAL